MPGVELLLMAALVATGAPLLWRAARGVARGHLAADLVAALAILTSLILLQPIPGLVVVLMQRGGEALERRAEGRASRAVAMLEAAFPETTRRASEPDLEVPVEDLEVGDVILVRPGDVVPADCIVATGRSHVETSSLTGEPVPLLATPGVALDSGTINQEGALNCTVTARTSESRYARVVELVRSAQASKAPIQRVADRAAVWFTPLTILTATLAWGISGDANRVLAVLVVATPCPLILATPVAVMGGINRAARYGIIMRSGGALEALSRIDTVVFDKTGTLTAGHPLVESIRVGSRFTEHRLLQLAGAVEQHSSHVLARVLTREALRAVGPLPDAAQVHEEAGRGIAGMVGPHLVRVGSPAFIEQHHPEATRALRQMGDEPGLRAWITMDGAAVGEVRFADLLRPDVRAMLDTFRQLGIARFALLSGDTAANVHAVGTDLGLSDARGDLFPGQKVEAVRAFEAQGHRVLMIGDGTNDAPALSAATVGMALASGGGGISAEAAGVVLLRDDLLLMPRAVAIGRQALAVARQSIGVGLGLSLVAMTAAAAGYIPPVAGAVLQEAIDVAVILNALRASKENS